LLKKISISADFGDLTTTKLPIWMQKFENEISGNENSFSALQLLYVISIKRKIIWEEKASITSEDYESV